MEEVDWAVQKGTDNSVEMLQRVYASFEAICVLSGNRSGKADNY